MKKLEGPTTSIVFLGILFDSITMTMRLEDEKLAAIHAELARWDDRTHSKEELQSIIGVLSFAAKVVAPGRTFLRRMIDHMRNHPKHHRSDQAFSTFRLFQTRSGVVASIPNKVEWYYRHPRLVMVASRRPAHLHRCLCPRIWCHVWPHWFACTWTEEEERQANVTPCLSKNCTHLPKLLLHGATVVWAQNSYSIPIANPTCQLGEKGIQKTRD